MARDGSGGEKNDTNEYRAAKAAREAKERAAAAAAAANTEANTKSTNILSFLNNSNSLLGGDIGDAPEGGGSTQAVADMIGKATGLDQRSDRFETHEDFLKAVQAGTEARQATAKKKKTSFTQGNTILGGSLSRNTGV